MRSEIQKLVKNSSNPTLIEDAFLFAKEAYADKFRSSENYIEHAIRVATMLDSMHLDSTTIAFALLHDVIDDLPDVTRTIEAKAIEKKFGSDLSQLVEKISDLTRIRYALVINLRDKKAFARDRLENMRKMFLAIASDLRVVVVELIARLDVLQTMQGFTEDRRKLYALETLQIFAPIANRLGLREIRTELEDTAFSYLFPDRFTWLQEKIKEQYEEREMYLKNFIPKLNKIFKKEGIPVIDINYRAKSYWSTYKKLFKYNMDFSKIHDLLALRIITADVESCYKAIGIIHQHFKPLSGEINDYIAKPKPNGYRSLHTTIFSDEEKITEIQIRTEEMQEEAEYGICAHWSYKEKIDLQKETKDFTWMKQAPDFWKTFKINFFSDQVFTFTPKGDIIILPKGSTPIDFAYAIHSEIGDHCQRAKINGKIIPLSQLLKNGDVISITTNYKRKPSEDWLRIVKTNFAKSHIKKATENQKTGFTFPIPGFIKNKFKQITEARKRQREEKIKISKGHPSQISLAGQKGILMRLAKCCNPKPGEKVKAYLARNRAAMLHRTSCSTFKKIAEKFPDKIIDASWG